MNTDINLRLVLIKFNAFCVSWSDLINGMSLEEENKMFKTKPTQEFVNNLNDALDALSRLRDKSDE